MRRSSRAASRPRPWARRLLPQGERGRRSTPTSRRCSRPDGSAVRLPLDPQPVHLRSLSGGRQDGRDHGPSSSPTDSDPHFDSLRFLDSAGTWSPDGTKFALAVLAPGGQRARDPRRALAPDRAAATECPRAWAASGTRPGRRTAGRIVFSGSVGRHHGPLSCRRRERAGAAADRRHLRRAAARVVAGRPDPGLRLRPRDGRRPDALTATTATWASGSSTWPAARRARSWPPWRASTAINPQFRPGRPGPLLPLRRRRGERRLPDVDRPAVSSSASPGLTTGVTGIARLSPALTVSERTGQVLFSVFNEDRYQIHALEAGAGARRAGGGGAATRRRRPGRLCCRLSGTAPQSLVTEYLETHPARPAGRPRSPSSRRTAGGSGSTSSDRRGRRLQQPAARPWAATSRPCSATTLGQHEVGVAI